MNNITKLIPQADQDYRNRLIDEANEQYDKRIDIAWKEYEAEVERAELSLRLKLSILSGETEC